MSLFFCILKAAGFICNSESFSYAGVAPAASPLSRSGGSYDFVQKLPPHSFMAKLSTFSFDYSPKAVYNILAALSGELAVP